MADGDTDANGVQEKTAPSLNDQIVRQIEYYFGDINLPRDKFLQEQVKLEDGWIPLEVILKFKRLSNLTTDFDVIVTALEASELMEVNEDKKKIRRNPNYPLPVFNEVRRKELMTRTIYCKGFPTEGTTLDQLLNFFSSYGPIDNVQMRSYREKETNKYIFKGSAFVIFKTKELAEDFLKEDIKYGDVELIKKWQSEYLEQKRKEYAMKKKTGKKDANNAKGGGGGGGGEGEEGGKEGKEEQKKDSLPKGAILHLKGINSETSLENIRETLLKEGLDVAYVTFIRGNEEAWVRLLGENSAKEYVEKLKDGKLTVCGAELDARSLDGEEEVKFLEKTKEEMKKRLQNFRNRKNRKGGRGGGRAGGKSGFVGKRKRSPTRDEPSKKQDTNETDD